MRTKVTLVLLFLNAVLFLFIFRFERAWRTNQAALEVRRRVLTTEAADIRAIEVAGTPTPFRLERRGDRWFLTKPFEWPANPNAVSRMIDDLKFLESDTSFSVADVLKNNLSLADYGLDHPKLEVTLASGGPDTTGQAAVSTTLKIGNTATDGRSLYLLSGDGSRIHVVGRELADSLDPSLDQLRSDAVLTIPVFEARLMSLRTRAAPSLHVQLRLDGSRWVFEAPIPTRADKDATELAINGLDALRVRRFLPPNPSAPPPSADPVLQAAIEGDNRRETLFLGAPVDPSAAAGPDGEREVLAQLEGRSALFTVMLPDHLLNTLENAQETLRDRHILDLDPTAATTVVLTAPNEPDLMLQRLESAAGPGLPADGQTRTAGSGWQIVRAGGAGQGPRTEPADSAEVEALLDRLAHLTATAFQSDAPQLSDLENWGFNRPIRIVRIDVPGAPETVLEVGQGAGRGGPIYARLANEQSIFAISPDLVEATPVEPRFWRDRRLPFVPAAATVSALALTDLRDGRVVARWAGGAASGPIPALLDNLRSLRARRFVEDAFADPVRGPGGESRPWRYRLDATLSLPAGAGGNQTRTASLLFTDRLGGTRQYAGSRELNAVFEIEQPLLDALWALTYGARDPGPRP